MSVWVVIIIIAYILNAGATLISKWLLVKDIPEPAVFTFYIGVLNGVAILLVPFGVMMPTLFIIAMALFSGAAYTGAMFFLAKALHIDQTSQVAPMVGGLQPLFVLLVSWWLFSADSLATMEYVGIGLLVVGSITMALEVAPNRVHVLVWLYNKLGWHPRQRFGVWVRQHVTTSWKYILLSSVLFAVSYTVLDYVYDLLATTYAIDPFITGFVWSRVGTIIAACAVLLLPRYRRLIFQHKQQPSPQARGWFVFGQIAGAISYVMVAYAISIGPVAIINALQGVQYVVLFVAIVALAPRFPQLLDEPLTKRVIIQKSIAITLIMAGLALVV